MSQPDFRAVLEAAYLRLLTRLAAKEVSAENSRSAALEALSQALAEMEVQPDPAWLSGELERLRATHAIPKSKDDTGEVE